MSLAIPNDEQCVMVPFSQRGKTLGFLLMVHRLAGQVGNDWEPCPSGQLTDQFLHSALGLVVWCVCWDWLCGACAGIGCVVRVLAQ